MKYNEYIMIHRQYKSLEGIIFVKENKYYKRFCFFKTYDKKLKFIKYIDVIPVKRTLTEIFNDLQWSKENIIFNGSKANFVKKFFTELLDISIEKG